MVANYITGEVSGDGDGSTGAVGPAGPTGPTGPSGPSGAAGAAGSSVVWRADWSQTTMYIANDVVAFNVPGPSYGYGAGEYSGIYIMREGYTTQGTYPPVGGGWQLLIPQIAGGAGPAGPAGAQGDVGVTGADGAPGATAVAPSTIYTTLSSFSYYGSSATTTHFNMASGSIGTLGSIAAAVVPSTTNMMTRQTRAKNAPSAVGGGQDAGWLGSITSVTTRFTQGFLYTYSFGIEDTAVNAATRTYIGLQQSSAAPVLSSTETVLSLTTPFCGLCAEAGETVFSWYTRGPSGFFKTPTTVPCTTPSELWYALTVENPPGTNDVFMTLRAYTYLGETQTATYSFSAGIAVAPSLTSANHVVLMRAMAAPGGTTGAAQLSLASVKIHTL